MPATYSINLEWKFKISNQTRVIQTKIYYLKIYLRIAVSHNKDTLWWLTEIRVSNLTRYTATGQIVQNITKSESNSVSQHPNNSSVSSRSSSNTSSSSSSSSSASSSSSSSSSRTNKHLISKYWQVTCILVCLFLYFSSGFFFKTLNIGTKSTIVS